MANWDATKVCESMTRIVSLAVCEERVRELSREKGRWKFDLTPDRSRDLDAKRAVK